VSAADLSVLQRSNDRMGRRRFVNRGMEALCWLAAALAVFLLAVVVWSVAKRGASAISWGFFVHPLHPFAAPNVKQGLADAFVGSLIIVGLATVMALPMGILIAIYVNEFASKSIRNVVTLTLDVLAGVPAIVIGFFVFQLLVAGNHQSGYAAGFALAVLMLPLVSRSTIEVLALVPDSLREAALGVGAPRWRMTVGVVLPQTIGGVLTGAVLAVARVAGETAPLLFTSSLFQNGVVSWNPSKPLNTVPLSIYELTDSYDPKDHARAWAGALVLILFILVVSLTARWFATRSRRKLAQADR
jgi:phosphate transport system permease protein